VSDRILLIEDDGRLAEMVSDYLGQSGFRVSRAANGAAGLQMQGADSFDIVVLDLMLPDMDGLDVCRQLRRRGGIPILMLTARGDAMDRIVGLEMGADDYISKPISPKVLVSRVNALFRRIHKDDGKTISIGNLTIDPMKFIVAVNGQDITLAKKEFELLYLLASKPGRVFLRNEILNQVWGQEVIVGDRTIDVHIRKIRQKLNLDCITTVKGVGYKFNLQ